MDIHRPRFTIFSPSSVKHPPCTNPFCWVQHTDTTSPTSLPPTSKRRCGLHIPKEVLVAVLDYLTVKEVIVTVQAVCIPWANAAVDDSVWCGRFERYFGVRCDHENDEVPLHKVFLRHWYPSNIVACGSRGHVVSMVSAPNGNLNVKIHYLTETYFCVFPPLPAPDSSSMIRFEFTLGKQISYHVAKSIGIIRDDYPVTVADPEYRDGFVGFYHGGASVNIIQNGKRVHRALEDTECPDWRDGDRIGIEVCVRSCQLWCIVNGRRLEDKFTLRGDGALPPYPFRFAVWAQHGQPIHIHPPRFIA
eukprot:PhF_6_TR28162/c1_g1_i4/m.41720